jgi:hypothetical protein
MDTIEAGRLNESLWAASQGHHALSTRLHLEKHVVRALNGQELRAVAGGQGVVRPPQHPR